MMLKKINCFIGLLLLSIGINSQTTETTPLIHSHNDYNNVMPFYEAYIHGASSIEMDIYFHKDELYVAHDFDKVKSTNTFEELYIKPLLQLLERGQEIKGNGSYQLQYLFDIKSNNSLACIEKLEQVCAKYPQIFGNKNQESLVKIVITGNRPSPNEYGSFSKFILFDGRPYEIYSKSELEKIGLISDSFKNYSGWNGRGRIIDKDLDTLNYVINKVHQLGKSLRFWATPNSKSSWEAFSQLGVDFINTHKTKEASLYFKNAHNSKHSSVNSHEVISLKDKTFKEVKNIILMIGDGMGVTQMSAGLLANGGKLNMGKLYNYGFSMTQSADDFTTDSAGGGTAMAIGKKTKNRYIGMDSEGNATESIMALADKNNMKTGIVTTDKLNGATPSSFFAHQLDRDLSKNILEDYMNSGVDLFIGKGKNVVESHFKNGIDVFRNKGFNPVVDDYSNLLNVVNPVVFMTKTGATGKGGNPLLLKEMTNSAIDYLSQDNEQGFFLMVEASNIDGGGHKNDIEMIVEEVLAFDKAIGEALKFAEAEGNTLVVITADHETGGLSLPQGKTIDGMVQGMFHSGDHTGVAVPVMAYGPGAHLFSGIYQNVDIYKKIISLLDIEN